MKKKIQVLIIFVVVLAAFGLIWWQYSSTNTNTSQTNQNKSAEEWATYENARYSFSVDYPANWQLGDAPTNNDGREFISADGKISCQAFGFQNALSGTGGSPQTLDEYIEWLVSIEKGKVIKKEQTTMAGYSAQNLITQSSDEKITNAIYVLGKETGRGLSCVFENQDSQNDFRADFKKMQDSFKIKMSLDG